MNKKEKRSQKQATCFLSFLKCEATHQRENGHIAVANNYTSAGHSFHRFLLSRGKNDVTFKQLSPLLANDYESWLLASGLCKNTCSFYARALQSVYNKAVKQGLTEDGAPFKGVYRGVARTVKRAIGPEAICRLCSLDIRKILIEQGYKPDSRRLAHRQRPLEFARDMFVFCFCARGLTFVDLAFMRKSNVSDGMITYVRRKTKQRIEVQVEPMMQTIIDRYPSTTDYLFPILTKTGNYNQVYQQYRYAITRYNACLAQLGKMLGHPKLTSYVSRHSWATTAYRQNIPLPVISQSMGHNSEKTTQIYLKSLEASVIHQTNRELLKHVFRKKEPKSNKKKFQKTISL